MSSFRIRSSQEFPSIITGPRAEDHADRSERVRLASWFRFPPAPTHHYRQHGAIGPWAPASWCDAGLTTPCTSTPMSWASSWPMIRTACAWTRAPERCSCQETRSSRANRSRPLHPSAALGRRHRTNPELVRSSRSAHGGRTYPLSLRGGRRGQSVDQSVTVSVPAASSAAVIRAPAEAAS